MNDDKTRKQIRARQLEITRQFLDELDKHLDDVLAARATEMYEISDFADLMHIHPRHLTNTVKLTTGKSPCDFFEERLVAISKRLLAESDDSISAIASSLTYDPSNFTKFFKRFTGLTPKQYRERARLERHALKTEGLTI